jgi:hypothetical protein
MRTLKLAACLVLLSGLAATAPAYAQTMDELAARGAALANADPLAGELRKRAPDETVRRGFDIGMAAAEGQTLPGPGKQKIHDALPAPQQVGFDTALSFSFQRNRNAQLAATGAAIARADAIVAQARTADADVFYWLGFDIASGIFGNPALGASGNTATGPGSLGIRNALNAAAQRGFNASVTLHLSRNYRTSVLQGSGISANTQVTAAATRPSPVESHVFKPPGPALDSQVVAIPADRARDRQCSEIFQLRRNAPYITAAWQPLNEEVHVFSIDAHGTLKDVWKHHDGFWEASFSLSAPGLSPAGAPLAAVWQPLNEQLEVFTIAPNGALQDIWKAHNGAWFAPIYISPPGFAPPSAHIAAIFQPLNNTLEVFAVDSTGAVRVVWKAQNGAWQRPFALTPPGSAPPGAPLAVVWQPLNEQLEVFWIDSTGAAREVLKRHNGPWQQPSIVAPAGFANAGAEIAAVWQPLNEQLEVFSTDRCGAIKDVWKAHNSAWFPPVVVYGAGAAPAGASLVALWGQQYEELRVIAVARSGQVMQAYKEHNRRWEQRQDLTREAIAPAAAPLVGVTTSDGHHEVFMLDDNQAVRVIRNGIKGLAGWYGSTLTRANFGPIYGRHAAFCTARFKQWSNGDDLHADDLDACIEFMGIKAHCADRDAFVAVGYPPQDTRPRFLVCSQIGHPENVLEQIVHIGRGVGEGLVTAAPFIALGLQAYACADGVLFACGTVAVDLAGRAGVIPDEVKVAYNLVNAAQQCSNGDILSCAKLGAAGAKAAGVSIPAEDAARVALLTQQCANDDFGACLRLGEKAADAAGVPINALNQAAKNARDCYDGDLEACYALGQLAAAQTDIPLQGVADGVENYQRCRDSGGRSLTDCRELGKALVAVAR